MFWLKHLANNPVSGLIVGIVGILLAVYFYYQSKISPELVYFVHPVKAALVRTGNVSDLETMYKGKKVEGNVTVAQIAVWNKGKQSIRSSNILKQVVIFSAANNAILEAKIRSVTREEIDFKIDQSQLELGKIPIAWAILEENDGAVIQIVYNGTENEPFKVSGTIEGQKSILTKDFSLKRSSNEIYYILPSISAVLILLYEIAMRYISRSKYIFNRTKYKRFNNIIDNENIYAVTVIALVSISTLISIMSYAILIVRGQVPFDF